LFQRVGTNATAENEATGEANCYQQRCGAAG